MKRTIIASTVVALALSGAGLASAKPQQSNGAQKVTVASAIGFAVDPAGLCGPASTDPAKAAGFAVLNAPGRPAKNGKASGVTKIVGEVALKDAPKGVYQVRLAKNAAECGETVATLEVRDQGDGTGNGNASISYPGTVGTYRVVILQVPTAGTPLELIPAGLGAFASPVVTLK